jgi:hypothetical protein
MALAQGAFSWSQNERDDVDVSPPQYRRAPARQAPVFCHIHPLAQIGPDLSRTGANAEQELGGTGGHPVDDAFVYNITCCYRCRDRNRIRANSFPDCDNEDDNDNEKPPPLCVFGFNPVLFAVPDKTEPSQRAEHA